jgi:hypothetical protein
MPAQVKQTRKASLTETLLNTFLGFGVALSAQVLVFPLFGIHIPLTSNFLIGAIFTVVSIGRGFVLRRLFEHLRVNGLLP